MKSAGVDMGRRPKHTRLPNIPSERWVANDMWTRLFAEWLATALLVAIVLGSGVMAARLANGNAAVALIANTLATAWGLYVLIEVFGPVSGAHMNPAVSVVMALTGALPRRLLVPYMVLQLAGGVCGAWLVHAMFEMTVLQWSTQVRSGMGIWIAEIVATAGLVLVVLRAPQHRVAALVGAYIGAAYWFTASTSFANPAVTFGRMLSDSFAGIAPVSVPAFVVAQMIGAVAGWGCHTLLRAKTVNDATSL